MSTEPILRIHRMLLSGDVWPPQARLTGIAVPPSRDDRQPLKVLIRSSRGVIAEGFADRSSPVPAPPGHFGFSVRVPFRRDVLLGIDLIAENQAGEQFSKRVSLPWVKSSPGSIGLFLGISLREVYRMFRRRMGAMPWPFGGAHEHWNYHKLRAHKFPSDERFEEARDEPVEQSPVKLLAFYLPQFHPIPENDDWWGKGFTEWRNVARAIPQFHGHFQPRLPADLGYYDLRVPEVMQRQVEMARHFGIEGFCFYYYWFAGRRLLERPLDAFLSNKHLDISFCLCWANENWTRRWDGSQHDILMAQDYSPELDDRFIEDLAPYFSDPRYIRVDGKPLLLVYRVNEIENMASKRERWSARAQALGFPGIHLVAAQTFGMTDPRVYGVDSAVEFPPHLPTRTVARDMYNTAFSGQVCEFDTLADVYKENKADGYELFKTVTPCWDNTARKENAARIFDHCGPGKYAEWLEVACLDTLRRLPEDRRLVFINAWNEWAEGAYLEPDQRFGYGFLNATAKVLEKLNERFMEREDGGAGPGQGGAG